MNCNDLFIVLTGLNHLLNIESQESASNYFSSVVFDYFGEIIEEFARKLDIFDFINESNRDLLDYFSPECWGTLGWKEEVLVHPSQLRKTFSANANANADVIWVVFCPCVPVASRWPRIGSLVESRGCSWQTCWWCRCCASDGNTRNTWWVLVVLHVRLCIGLCFGHTTIDVPGVWSAGNSMATTSREPLDSIRLLDTCAQRLASCLPDIHTHRRPRVERMLLTF